MVSGFVRSDSVGSKSAGVFTRSDSVSSKSAGLFTRSDSVSSKSAGGNTKRAIFGAFVMCTFAVILIQHAWYAHELVIGVGLEQFNSDPRTEEELEVVARLSLLQEHLSATTHQDLPGELSQTPIYNILDQRFNNTGKLNTHISSSGLGLSDGAATANVEEIQHGEIGDELEPDWEGAANTTESTKSSVAALNVRNKLVAEELGQKEEPEEVVSIRDNEVSSVAAVELKEDGNAAANATAVEREEREEVIPRAIPRTWEPPKKCATAEEMGAATVGDTRAASLRVRAMIQRFVAKHGAERVRNLPAEEFCQQGFVLGQSLEDGFGNNMYKVLTAAGVAVMLNRSVIIAERAAMRASWQEHPKHMPKRAFGDYLEFSNETFTVREVRKLWGIRGCETNYSRSLIVQTETLDQGFRQTRCICDDWTTLTVPIFEFKGATGAGAIQLLLKNEHPAMRAAAVKLLGNPALPDSRPNTFGELFRAFIAPNADIQEAVQWALKGGPDPDITLHLRMLHSKSKPGPAAASTCINRIRQQISLKHPTRERRPRLVVVTDTPSVVPGLKHALGHGVELVQFDYAEYSKSIREDSVLSLDKGLPAPERVKDWGEMPRWVAMVDFFLAARARTAVVSGAFQRVSTTYAQLVAALAGAYTLDEHGPPRPACVYYSSFQPPLLTTGLKAQCGWGFSWRPFAGRLGCRNQAAQCAKTALLPYTWWDAPWQSPISGDIKILHAMAGLDATGQVSEKTMKSYCAAARETELVKMTLAVPSYEQALAAA